MQKTLQIVKSHARKKTSAWRAFLGKYTEVHVNKTYHLQFKSLHCKTGSLPRITLLLNPCKDKRLSLKTLINQQPLHYNYHVMIALEALKYLTFYKPPRHIQAQHLSSFQQQQLQHTVALHLDHQWEVYERERNTVCDYTNAELTLEVKGEAPSALSFHYLGLTTLFLVNERGTSEPFP